MLVARLALDCNKAGKVMLLVPSPVQCYWFGTAPLRGIRLISLTKRRQNIQQ